MATREAHEQIVHILHYLCLLYNDIRMCLFSKLIKTLTELSYEDSKEENTDTEHKHPVNDDSKPAVGADGMATLLHFSYAWNVTYLNPSDP